MLLDMAAYESIMGPSSSPVFDRLMVIAGEYLILLLPVLALVLWMRGREGRRDAVLITASGVVTLALSYLAGLLYSHPSPFMLMETVVGGVPENGFPSQHTAVTASIIWPLLERHQRLGLIATAGAMGTGLARIYIGEHFLVDVIGAFIIAFIGYHLVQATEDRYHPIEAVLDRAEPHLPGALLAGDDE